MSDVEAAGWAVARGEDPTRRRVGLIFVGLLLAVLAASLNRTVVSTALLPFALVWALEEVPLRKTVEKTSGLGES